MPIDASVYGNLKGPAPLDINGMVGTARNALQLQGESSLGDIYGKSTNEDGTIDTGKLGRLAPQAGVLAPKIAEQAQSLQQGQQTIDRSKLDNIREWWKTLDNAVYSHINDPDLEGKKVLDTIHGLIGHKNSDLNGGIFTPQLAVKTAQQLYGPNGKLLPPEQIRQKLAQFHNQVLDHLQASEYVTVGNNPDGSPRMMTRNGAVVSDAAAPRGGAYGGNAGAPGQTPQPSAQAASGGPAQAPTLPPGRVEATAAVGLASGNQLAADQQSNANYRREVLPLEQAIPALEKLSQTGTGPGADEFNQIKSFLVTAGADKLLGIDLDKIKNFDEAKKYLTDWVMATGNTGTNDKLAAAFSSNASTSISNMAAQDVAKMALSIRRMKAAQTAEWQKTGLPADQYTRWAGDWNRTQDPRAYGADLMGAEKVKKLVSSLSDKSPGKGQTVNGKQLDLPSERQRFIDSLRVAHENQLTSPKGGWQNEPQQ